MIDWFVLEVEEVISFSHDFLLELLVTVDVVDPHDQVCSGIIHHTESDQSNGWIEEQPVVDRFLEFLIDFLFFLIRLLLSLVVLNQIEHVWSFFHITVEDMQIVFLVVPFYLLKL